MRCGVHGHQFVNLLAVPEPQCYPPHFSAVRSPSDLKPLTILAIDDDPAMLLLYQAFLKSKGHTVVIANDGIEGLSRLKETRFDLVLTDHAMPGMNGYEVGAAVKALHPHLPVVMVSGSIEWLPLPLDGIAAIDVLVRKPFNFAELLAGIAKALTPV